MTRFITTWLDYSLPTGQEFAVAVCGYTGKIQYLTIEEDKSIRELLTSVEVTDKRCEAGESCLVLSCRYNKTGPDQIAQMLKVSPCESLDTAAVEIWQTESTVDALVKFVDKMNEALPDHFRLMQKQDVKSD
jgi:hypothetical protein